MLNCPYAAKKRLFLAVLLLVVSLSCIQQALWTTWPCNNINSNTADYSFDAPFVVRKDHYIAAEDDRDDGGANDDDDIIHKARRSATTATFLHPPQPTSMYVLGERNSGTNYVSGTLRSAFEPPNAVDKQKTHEYFASDIPILKHKHMLRHSLLTHHELQQLKQRTDIVWLLVVRRPCDWAEAMKRMPYHMCNPTNISLDCGGPGNTELVGLDHKRLLRTNYTLAQYFTLPWGDWTESTNYRNLSIAPDSGTIKFTPYRNVFHLRKHKLEIMKQIIDTVPHNVKIVRLHELELSPEMFITNIVQQYNLSLKEHYQLRKPSAKKHVEQCLSYEEWTIAQREIDWDMERYFGYSPLDCHLCYDGGIDASRSIVPRYEVELVADGSRRREKLRLEKMKKKEEANETAVSLTATKKKTQEQDIK